MSKKNTLSLGVLLAIILLPLLSLAQKVITGRVLSQSDQSPIAGASVSNT